MTDNEAIPSNKKTTQTPHTAHMNGAVVTEEYHGELSELRSIRYQDGELWILDQTQLPERTVIERQDSVEQVWSSIKQLKVRGAPAIGVAAAYGLVVGLRRYRTVSGSELCEHAQRLGAYLIESRPTAVNLAWAVRRMLTKAEEFLSPGGGAASGGGAALSGDVDRTPDSSTTASAERLYAELELEAGRIHTEDIALCRAIGEHGRPLIKPNIGVLTHCNAGRLATSDYGTATAPMYLAHREGVPFRVYADESRPLLQGARLTSWELYAAGIDVTVITDNMAAFVMSQGLVDLVIVGTDRVAANGDVANKIGTLGVAILARHFEIPFYVACPSSTVDLETPTGAEIVIEERGPEEVRSFGLRRTTPPDVQVRNPAFDVTPHELVTGLITERGIVAPPLAEGLRKLFSNR